MVLSSLMVTRQQLLHLVEKNVIQARGWRGLGRLPISPEEIRKVLVIRNNDLGDVLLATPLFRALKRSLPQAAVHACIGPWAQDLLLGNSHVDRVVASPIPWGNRKLRGGWREAMAFLYRSPLTNQLRSEKYDVGIDVAGNLWTAWLLKRAGVRLRIGIGGYQGGGLLNHISVPFTVDEHVSRKGLRLLEPLGIFSSDTCLEFPLSHQDHAGTSGLLRKVGINSTEAYIVLSPGVGWPPSKSWLPEYFAEVGRMCFAELGWRSLVTGSPSERSLTSRVAEGIGPSGHDLGGKTSIRQFGSLIRGARLVVCNSSVSMHIAHALGTPSVVIVGGIDGGLSVNRRLWGYPTGCTLLGTDDRDCSVLCGPYCATRDCMRAITPQEVFEASKSLLAMHSQSRIEQDYVARA